MFGKNHALDQKSVYQKVTVRGKSYPYFVKGNGSIPLFFVGAAGLFCKEEVMPSEKLGDTYTIYFIDFWDLSCHGKAQSAEEKGKHSSSVDKLTWTMIADEIDSARQQLKLPKIAVFGQSAGGAIALEYRYRFPQHCLAAFVFNSPPQWKGLPEQQQTFLEANACDARKCLLKRGEREQQQIEKLDPPASPEKVFKSSFLNKRALFWRRPDEIAILRMWAEYQPDVMRVFEFFGSMLQDSYDMRTRFSRDNVVPVLFGMGIYDGFAPFYQLTDESKDLLKKPYVNYHLFDCGHYPMIEESQKFVEVMKRFAQQQILKMTPPSFSQKSSAI